jgi:hypothetical protein
MHSQRSALQPVQAAAEACWGAYQELLPIEVSAADARSHPFVRRQAGTVRPDELPVEAGPLN